MNRAPDRKAHQNANRRCAPEKQSDTSAPKQRSAAAGLAAVSSHDGARCAKNIATKISLLQGWRRFALAFLAGLSSVLAMAPFFLSPILFVTFPLLLWLIDGAMLGDRNAPATVQDVEEQATTSTTSTIGTASGTGTTGIGKHFTSLGLNDRLRAALSAAIIGWWFAFGYFLGGLYWIGSAFLVEAETFAWLLPFAVTLMPAGLALFWAAAMGIAALLWRPSLQRIITLAVSLSGFEWLRGHILTGFPWNVPGYALSYPLVLMQNAGLVGIYGLTLIALIVFTAPLVIWFERSGPALANGNLNPRPNRNAKPNLNPGRNPGRRAVAAIATAVLPIAAMAIYGWQRLAEPLIPPKKPVTVRVVQPSIIQSEKWQPQHQTRIFNQHLALSRRNAAGRLDNLRGTTLLIWPEAAMPFLPLRKPAALRAIAKLLPAGTVLLAGALRMEEPVPELPWSRRRVFNSAMLFGSKGNLLAKYDKTHLVPFGEYLPFQETLEAVGLQQLTRLRGGFAAGSTPRPLITIPGLPKIGILICYEVIFPSVVAQAQARPDFLVNLTNDGWFGNSTGPRQHLHQARVRAVEEGLALIRAGNNGISAVIDPYGRIIKTLKLDQIGVIDAQVPQKITAPGYSRYGDIVFTIMWLICLIFPLVRFYRPSS